MKSIYLFGAVAALSVLSACDISSEEPPSAAEIKNALESGDLGKAQRMIALAHEAVGEDRDIRMLAAKVSLARGDGITAQTSLQAAKKAGIADKVILPLLAEAQARQGKFEEAATTAKESGNKSLPHHINGLKYEAENKPWEAREALEEAYELDGGGNSRLALDLAKARTKLGLITGARKAIATVMKAEPRNMLAALALGDTEMRAGRHEAAQKAFAQALKLAPGSNDALLGQVRALYASGQYADAKKAVIALSREVALRPEIQLLAGKIAMRNNDHGNARKHFSNSRSLIDSDAEAQYLLAQVHMVSGQPYKAIQLLETATASRPDMPEYHAALIGAYRKTGDETSATNRLSNVPESIRNAKELRGL